MVCEFRNTNCAAIRSTTDFWTIGLRKWSANSEITTVQLLDPLHIDRND